MIYSMGRNTSGQLATGDKLSRSTFELISNCEFYEQNIRILSCGSNTTTIVTDKNEIWSAGMNEKGQLGLNNTTPALTFTKALLPISGNHSTITTYASGGEHSFVVLGKYSLSYLIMEANIDHK
jgi:alpha-tubulin suppressor-like RCC1 family protein